MHAHTHYSSDSNISIKRWIELAPRRGIDAMAITDHNLIEGAQELQSKAPFPVIVGEEVSTRDGEIIGLFLTEKIPAGLSAVETVAAIKGQGGLVYIPHPFDPVRGHLLFSALQRIHEHIDILEVFNARVTFPTHNRKAEEYAARHNLRQAASSDSHFPLEIGNAYSEVPDWTTKEEFLTSMSQSKPTGRLTTRAVMVQSGLQMLSNYIKSS